MPFAPDLAQQVRGAPNNAAGGRTGGSVALRTGGTHNRARGVSSAAAAAARAFLEHIFCLPCSLCTQLVAVFRAAFATSNPRLIEPALSCLHKLVSGQSGGQVD